MGHLLPFPTLRGPTAPTPLEAASLKDLLSNDP